MNDRVREIDRQRERKKKINDKKYVLELKKKGGRAKGKENKAQWWKYLKKEKEREGVFERKIESDRC